MFRNSLCNQRSRLAPFSFLLSSNTFLLYKIQNPCFGIISSTMVSNHPSLRILLVETAADFIYLFERYAQQGKWKLFIARNTEETTRLAREIHPDVIFINSWVQLADDSWAILKALKVRPGLREIPAVVYSSLPKPERARQEGADFSLCKPVLYEDVERIVESLKDYRQPIRKLGIIGDVQGGAQKASSSFALPDQSQK